MCHSVSWRPKNVLIPPRLSRRSPLRYLTRNCSLASIKVSNPWLKRWAWFGHFEWLRRSQISIAPVVQIAVSSVGATSNRAPAVVESGPAFPGSAKAMRIGIWGMCLRFDAAPTELVAIFVFVSIKILLLRSFPKPSKLPPRAESSRPWAILLNHFMVS